MLNIKDGYNNEQIIHNVYEMDEFLVLYIQNHLYHTSGSFHLTIILPLNKQGKMGKKLPSLVRIFYCVNTPYPMDNC